MRDKVLSIGSYFRILKRQECQHERITPESVNKFCPDCGKEIEINWYIVRCECCKTKRRAYLNFDLIEPHDNFCTKCGSTEYFVEKKRKPDFFDFNYAVLKKEIIDLNMQCKSSTQIWIDMHNNWSDYIAPKLIPIFSK